MIAPAAANPVESADRVSRERRWPARAAIVATSSALSMAGVISLLFMTPAGIGTSPDSVGYLQAARSIVSDGSGALFSREATGAVALTHFAPLFSFLLAIGGLLGMDPYDWARWLGALVFGANVLMVGVMLRCALDRDNWLWVVGVGLMLGSAPMLTVHVTLLSEPVFLLLTFLGLWLLAGYLDAPTRGRLVLAALAIGMAWLARYAGVATVVTGGVALLTFAGRSFRRRILDASLFAAVSGAGMLAWMLRNALVSYSATGREIVFHPIDRSQAWQALYTASSWLLIPVSAPDWVRLAAWAALGAAAAVVLTALGRATPRGSEGWPAERPYGAGTLVRLLALFAATYAAFLVVSISFFDANTQLDDRILSPVYVAGLVLGLWLAQGLATIAAPRPALAGLLAVGLVAFTCAQIVRGAGLVAAGHELGWGFSGNAWRESATLERVRRLPETVALFSNVPELIYLHTGRTAQGLPRPWLPMNRQPNPDFPTQMAALEHTLSQERSVIVLFSGLRGVPAGGGRLEPPVKLPMRVWEDYADSVILCAVCPE